MKAFAPWITLLSLLGCKQGTSAHFERMADELPAAEEEAIRVGLPMHPRELAPPRLMPEEDARLLLSEAHKVFNRIKVSERVNISALSRSVEEQDQLRCRELLRLAEPGFQLIEQVQQRKGIDLGTRWEASDFVDMEMTWINHCQVVVKWTLARALNAARQSNSDVACSAIESCFAIGEFIGEDPTMISALMRVALDMKTLRHLEEVASICPALATIHRLRNLVQRYSIKRDLLYYLQGELLFMREFTRRLPNMSIEELQQMTFAIEPQKLLPSGVSRETIARAYDTRCLQFFTELAQNLNKEQDLLTQVKVVKRSAKRAKSNLDQTYQCLRASGNVYEQFGNALLKREAKRVVVDAMLAALEFQQRNGRYPKTLVEAGVTGLDPFSQRPLKMRVDKESIVVWSVGLDLHDDGASELENKDIVARFPRGL